MLPGGSAVMQTFCLLLLAEYFMGLAGQTQRWTRYGAALW